ncbi:hypothetical protein EV182_003121 [Spiromyces aspiralis]|uniref:Uncharacterized protein n=1 Tax=Spiromyces aspiralis TaxID=68401 RepID=A0ACC1HH31_9FUNG|nr:hypothetical protein EV182_003121 [Spiromyces aspiralis]
MFSRIKVLLIIGFCALIFVSTRLLVSRSSLDFRSIPLTSYLSDTDTNFNSMPPASPAPTRAKAAIVALVRNSDLKGMRSTVRQIEDRFNHKFNYPYIFLNDQPFTDEFKHGISFVTNSEVRYGTLNASDWNLPDHMDPAKVELALEKNKHRYIYGGSLSYRFMCRFQSGLFFDHPLLQDLEYYWRIEPDVDYYCDIDYDPFLFMKENGYRYGFTIAPLEWKKTVETLWPTTLRWIQQNPHHLPDKSMIDWVVDNNGDYNMCHFWSNFEIVDLSLYRSEAYRSYFDYLDKSGGFFYERWGDAPVHSIAASMFLSRDEIHWFEDIGYNHPGNMHCPRPQELNLRCICDSTKSYTYRSHCQRRFAEVKDISKFDALQKVHARLGLSPPPPPPPYQ